MLVFSKSCLVRLGQAILRRLLQHPASLLPEEEKTSISVLLVFSKSCSYVNSSSVPEDIFVKLLITNTLGPHIILIYYLDFKTSFLTNRKQKYHFHITLSKFNYKYFFRETPVHVVLNKYKYKIISQEDLLQIVLKNKYKCQKYKQE